MVRSAEGGRLERGAGQAAANKRGSQVSGQVTRAIAWLNSSRSFIDSNPKFTMNSISQPRESLNNYQSKYDMQLKNFC